MLDGAWVSDIMRMWPRNWGWQLNNYVLNLAVHVGVRIITWLNIGWSDKADPAPTGQQSFALLLWPQVE